LLYQRHTHQTRPESSVSDAPAFFAGQGIENPAARWGYFPRRDENQAGSTCDRDERNAIGLGKIRVATPSFRSEFVHRVGFALALERASSRAGS